MFEFVNEIAVLGTTFFMMAFGTLWYSEYAFQKKWREAVGLTPADIEADTINMKRNVAVTFVAYLIPILLLAILLGHTEVLQLPSLQIAGGVLLGFISFLAGFVIWEQRSLNYYLITSGFASVFVLGSTLLLLYWPW